MSSFCCSGAWFVSVSGGLAWCTRASGLARVPARTWLQFPHRLTEYFTTRLRLPDGRDRRRGDRLAVARQPVSGLDGGQDAVVGDRPGVTARPHPLSSEDRHDVIGLAAVVLVPGQDPQPVVAP